MDQDNILQSVKRILGLENDYDAFDQDIIFFINGELMTLAQNGVGQEGFRVKTGNETWSSFLGDFQDVELAKEFVYLRVRLMFDPPSQSAVQQAYTDKAAEALWRCREQVEVFREMSPVNPDDDEIYQGDYDVTPRVFEQTLYTDGLFMADDVDVDGIPVQEVSNPSGGQTAVIG